MDYKWAIAHPAAETAKLRLPHGTHCKQADGRLVGTYLATAFFIPR